MEKDYKLEWIKEVTKFDKPALECNNFEEGDFTIYKFDKDNKEFPGFAEIRSGGTVRGKMYTNPKGYKTLYPLYEKKSNGAFKQMQVEKTMQRKEESIQKFQDTKEYSIKVSSTFRAAHETAVVEWQENRRLSTTGPSIEQLFSKWREFYWNNFDVHEQDFPPSV